MGAVNEVLCTVGVAFALFDFGAEHVQFVIFIYRKQTGCAVSFKNKGQLKVIHNGQLLS